MKPHIKWDFGKLKCNNKGPLFNIGHGEADPQKQIQVAREKKVLTARYYYEQDVPANPVEPETLVVVDT
jgi:hypothetical protein